MGADPRPPVGAGTARQGQEKLPSGVRYPVILV